MDDHKYFTVPIITEATRIIDGYEMVRCSYLTIEADEPLPNWQLGLNKKRYNIILINLEAIVLGAPDSPDSFRTAKDIIDTYDDIEDNSNLFVDINDIWIPVHWFRGKKILNVGLYRLPSFLFNACWKYRNDKIAIKEFLSAKKDTEVIEFSQIETTAFKDWMEIQIEDSKKSYHNQPDKKLSKQQYGTA